MFLILAIEPDRRQASRVSDIAAECLEAELVVTESIDEALEVLTSRVPDLILTSFLLSPRDGARLADGLRELDSAGTHVQTLVIPVLAGSTPPTREPSGGLLNKLRRSKKPVAATPDGCDPKVFAAQIAEYLDRLAAERERAVARDSEMGLQPVGEVHPPPAQKYAPPREDDFVFDASRDVEELLRLPEPVSSVEAEAPLALGPGRDEEVPEPEPVSVANDASGRIDNEVFLGAADDAIRDGDPQEPESVPVTSSAFDEVDQEATPLATADQHAAADLVESAIAVAEESAVTEEPELELNAVEPVELPPAMDRDSAAPVEPLPLEASEPEQDDEALSGLDLESRELGSDCWNDLGFAPNTAARARDDLAGLTTEAVISSDSGISLSAELIDLATFVADLRLVTLSLPAPTPPASASEGDLASRAPVGDSAQAEASIDPGLPDVASASPSGTAFQSTDPDAGHPIEDPGASGPVKTRRNAQSHPPLPPAAPHPAMPSPELLHMLAAIRRDLQMMRAADGPHGSASSASTGEVEARSGSEHKDGAVGARAPQKGTPLTKRAVKVAAKAKKKRNKRKTVVEPLQEDSDFLDPEQCGFAALIAKLQEVYEPGDTAGAAD